jgi:hypothetical protein
MAAKMRKNVECQWIFRYFVTMVVVSRFLTSVFSLGRAQGMLVFPFILIKEKRFQQNASFMNHEKIHFQQAVELLVVGFYLLYLLEFVIRLLQCRSATRAYHGISLEREAYANDHNLGYLKERKRWAWLRYLVRSAI